MEGLELGGANAVAAANYFHFTEHSPIVTKAYLNSFSEVNNRIGTYAKYGDFSFDKQGRIMKRDEKYLEKIRFEFHPEEII